MRVTLLQTDIKWNNPQENLLRAEQMIGSAEVSDLYVLPEMFATGFMPDGNDTIRYDNILEWMKRVARERDAAITGSVAVRTEDGNWRNRMYFVKPDGTVVYYDKRHLFTYGGEDQHYTAGEEPVIVEWRGVRIMLQVCYDLRFPCFSRNKSPFYDLCIYVASWPQSRRMVWDTLLRARALENQCYVIGVNRVGDDPSCHYDGGSTVISPYGKSITTAEDDKEDIITAVLDMDSLMRFREKFPVLKDAD